MWRHAFRTKALSNAAFLVPAALAVDARLYLHTALILLTACASFAYHSSNELKGAWLDRALAYGLVGSNVSLLLQSDLSGPFSLLALCALALALTYFYVLGRDDWEWHVSSAVITASCVMAFATTDN